MPGNTSGKKTSRQRFGAFRHALLVIFGSALGSILFLLTAIFFIGDPMGDVLESAFRWFFGANPDKLDYYQREYIKDLIENGQLVSPQLYFDQIGSYYSNIISILFGIMGAMGFAGFLYIRAASKGEAEDLAAEAAQREFRTAAFRDLARQQLEEVLDKSDSFKAFLDDRAEEIEKLATRLDKFEDRLEESVRRLAKEDRSQDEGGDLDLAEQEPKHEDS